MSERKIIEYFIISANDNDSLAEKINGLITRDWQPLGGVSFQRNSGEAYHLAEWYFQQAMVKYE